MSRIGQLYEHKRKGFTLKIIGERPFDQYRVEIIDDNGVSGLSKGKIGDVAQGAIKYSYKRIKNGEYSKHKQKLNT